MIEFLLSILKNKSFHNITIKILSVGPKFVLSFLIAKKLSFEEFGQFTLFSTTILLISTFIGLEYHNYSNRRIINQKQDYLKNKIFSTQLNLYILLYILILFPTALVLKKTGFIPVDVFYIFVFIAITEHLSIELFRLLVILEKPIIASISMFLRTGFWAIFAIIFLINVTAEVNIVWIYSFWLSGSVLSLIVGFYYLELDYNFSSIKELKIVSLLTQIRSSFDFLYIVLCSKLIEVFGRYFMAYFEEQEMLGIYSLFFQISNIINVIVFSGLFVFYLPLGLKTYNGKISSIESTKKFQREIIQISIGLSFLIFLLIPILIIYFENNLIEDYIWVLIMLVLSQIFLNLFYVSYLQLYSSKSDKKILIIYLLSAFAQIILAILLQFIVEPIYGLTLSVLLSNFLLFILGKSFVSRKIKEEG